jgi:hypothetical protein
MKSSAEHKAVAKAPRPAARKTRRAPVASRSSSAVLAQLMAFARKHGVRMGGRKPTRAERRDR